MQQEAKARIRINDLLLKSGWRFFDGKTGPANVILEAHVKLTKKKLDALGEDFEKTAKGFVDNFFLKSKKTCKKNLRISRN
jgi:type I restriction enzyme, R subunit